jgi:hypothetical protein
MQVGLGRNCIGRGLIPVTLAVVLGGILIFSLVYYYFPKYGGVYWFKGPVTTIDMAPGHSHELGKEYGHGAVAIKEVENDEVGESLERKDVDVKVVPASR